MDTRRSIWTSSLLHLVLIGGSIVFALPYAWLVGTSFKLDKEVQSAEFRILPEKPAPVAVSPYIAPDQFAEITRPEHVSAERWSDWMDARVRERIRAAVSAWRDPRREGLPPEAVEETLSRGVFARLLNLVPHGAWQEAPEPEFLDAVDKVLKPELVAESFEQAYRYFAIGAIQVKTLDYQVHNLTGDTPVEQLWRVERGPLQLTPRIEADRPIAAGQYNLHDADGFELASLFTVPFDLADPQGGFKRLEVSYRSDQSWHDLRVLIEMSGKLYKAAAPTYLGDDRWWEVRYQFPSSDDQQLMPRRYILLDEVAAGSEYDHGPRTMKVRVQVERSRQPEAYWAKFSENYRRAFEEVPFWRYFKTSVFLVAANIIGTLLSCSLAAYAFARLNWPGRDLCFVLVLATLMIPPQVTMIPSFIIYKYLGWYNTLAPLWVPNWLAVNAFGIFLLRQAMRGIPRDLEEAAKIDGCGHLRIYWNVVLPLVKPTLAAISIFTFMFVWNDFMAPLIYVNDQRLYPLSLGLFSFMAGRENQFTLIMAGSMIMTLPVIITFFLAQRYFIQGIAMSGMKN